MIEKFRVRLADLPWWWVRADHLFDSVSELGAFAVLSKDAPYSLALAVEEKVGFRFFNLDLPLEVLGMGLSSSQAPGVEAKDLYVPLGFAQDVEEWRERFGNALPEGHWVEFADLTRTMAEGGDGDRWFAAHFVGPMWWVVMPGPLPGDLRVLPRRS